jgi:serine/threonine protein kinase
MNVESESSSVPKTPTQAADLGSFGKYRLVRKLAAGGMAQLYLAQIDGPDGFSKTCVMKKILPHLADNGDFAEMFITEAKVAAWVNHPNIVQVFDFGKVADQYYLAMEYIDGPTLHEMILRAAKVGKALGPRMAVHLGIPLCDALEYIALLTAPDGEPLNLVHRDVTPGNVLISKGAEVKLTDFGVVKSALNAKSTQAGVVKGKFAYMSPEQAMAKGLDHRSDIFSLGVVLYEVATGKRLWKRAPPVQMIAAVIHSEIPRPSEVVPDFPLGVERILMKALARNPDERYQSAREMLADLDAFRQAQNWSSGRRELHGLITNYFPELTSNVVPLTNRVGGSINTPPPASLAPNPERPVASPSSTMPLVSSISHPLVESVPGLRIYEGTPLSDLDEDGTEGGGSGVKEIALSVIAILLASALFWVFVLS